MVPDSMRQRQPVKLAIQTQSYLSRGLHEATLPPVRCHRSPEGPRGAYNRLVWLLTDARQFPMSVDRPVLALLVPLT